MIIFVVLPNIYADSFFKKRYYSNENLLSVTFENLIKKKTLIRIKSGCITINEEIIMAVWGKCS